MNDERNNPARANVASHCERFKKFSDAAQEIIDSLEKIIGLLLRTFWHQCPWHRRHQRNPLPYRDCYN